MHCGKIQFTIWNVGVHDLRHGSLLPSWSGATHSGSFQVSIRVVLSKSWLKVALCPWKVLP